MKGKNVKMTLVVVGLISIIPAFEYLLAIFIYFASPTARSPRLYTAHQADSALSFSPVKPGTQILLDILEFLDDPIGGCCRDHHVNELSRPDVPCDPAAPAVLADMVGE